MSDHSERWVLNRLIEMCRDEEESLRYLADHIQDQAMKSLLAELADRRSRFAADLVPHAQRLGGFEAHDGTARGAWHRRWRTIRERWTRPSDAARIAAAQREERRVLDMYGGALDMILPPGTRDLVENQAREIRRDQGHMQVHLP